MTSLEHITLAGLTGTLPTELALLTNVYYMDFDKNFLNGTIPTEIGLLSDLREIWFFGNGLTGTIPTEMGQLSRYVRNVKLRWR